MKESPGYDAVCDRLVNEPRRWLVTGVAGFIGSALLERLLDLGQTVVGFEALHQDVGAFEEFFAQPREKSEFQTLDYIPEDDSDDFGIGQDADRAVQTSE